MGKNRHVVSPGLGLHNTLKLKTLQKLRADSTGVPRTSFRILRMLSIRKNPEKRVG